MSWRFLPVRRLVLMVMKALDLATQWAVFEPNDTGTRERLRMSILIYLATLWQQGQLAGASMDGRSSYGAMTRTIAHRTWRLVVCAWTSALRRRSPSSSWWYGCGVRAMSSKSRSGRLSVAGG